MLTAKAPLHSQFLAIATDNFFSTLAIDLLPRVILRHIYMDFESAAYLFFLLRLTSSRCRIVVCSVRLCEIVFLWRVLTVFTPSRPKLYEIADKTYTRGPKHTRISIEFPNIKNKVSFYFTTIPLTGFGCPWRWRSVICPCVPWPRVGPLHEPPSLRTWRPSR